MHERASRFLNDHRKAILVALLFALLLRFLVILSMEPWWDENLYTVRSYNFFASGNLSTIDQAPLFFYLTDLLYKFLGLSVFTSRGIALLSGLLSIPLLYLLIMKTDGDKKVAILSAIFLSFSGYHAIFSIGEMDIPATLFILLSLLFFSLAQGDRRYYLALAASIGAGVLIKSSILFFALVIFLYQLHLWHKQNCLSLQGVLAKTGGPKYIIAVPLIFLLLSSPILIYNHLLFQQKGFMDVIFTKFLRIEDNPYTGIGTPEFDPAILPQTIPNIGGYFLRYDAPLFLLGIAGFFFAPRKNHSDLLRLCFLFPLLFLLSSTQLPKHFSTFAPFYSYFAASLLFHARTKFSLPKPAFYALIAAILLLSSYLLYDSLDKFAPTLKLREFAEKIGKESTLFLADSRIYSGKTAWALMDRHYAELKELSAVPFATADTGRPQAYDVYYIDCVSGDCGWGAGKVDPNLGKEAIDALKARMEKIEDIPGPAGPYYSIYKGKMSFEPNSIGQVDFVHQFYFYPIGWKVPSLAYDRYELRTDTERWLQNIGMAAIYASILLFFAFALYVLLQFWKSG